jgi:hypothetical protein
LPFKFNLQRYSAAVWFGRGEDGRSGKPTAARVSFAPEVGLCTSNQVDP